MKDYAGISIGKLTFIRRIRAGGDGTGQIWLVECDCGNQFEAPARQVTNQRKTKCANCSGRVTGYSRAIGVRAGYRVSYLEYLRRLQKDHPGEEPASVKEFNRIVLTRCSICRRNPSRGARRGVLAHSLVSLCQRCRKYSDLSNLTDFLELIGSVLAHYPRVAGNNTK